jgi:membrane associated rhomboid family serine protease
MRRYPSAHVSSISFGPGPLSQSLKALIGVNVVLFLAQAAIPGLTRALGLWPAAVVGELQVWRPATYMFLHGGVFHLLFNMLVLWMFGTELERIWGTRGFLKFYFVTGVGAGVLTVLFSILPIDIAGEIRQSLVIGASGAIYGLLLAYGLYFPDRPILMALLFPIPAKYFVMIIGAIAFMSSASASQGGVAHIAHLGGLLWGYVYLKGGRTGVLAEIKYRYLRWKMSRLRQKFTVHSTGRHHDSERRPH